MYTSTIGGAHNEQVDPNQFEYGGFASRKRMLWTTARELVEFGRKALSCVEMAGCLFTASLHIKAGKLRALAVAGPRRVKNGVDVTQWHALFAPANTPRPSSTSSTRR